MPKYLFIFADIFQFISKIKDLEENLISCNRIDFFPKKSIKKSYKIIFIFNI